MIGELIRTIVETSINNGLNDIIEIAFFDHQTLEWMLICMKPQTENHYLVLLKYSFRVFIIYERVDQMPRNIYWYEIKILRSFLGLLNVVFTKSLS